MTTILVIEDDEPIRRMIGEFLEGEGHTVVAFAHGDGALTHLNANGPPGLVLLDLGLPLEYDGSFVRRVREASGTDAPVIVISGRRDAASVAREIGADGWLAKPFDLEALAAVIRERLEGTTS